MKDIEVRLLSRSNEVLAIKRTDAERLWCSSKPIWRAARAGCRRR